MNSRKSGVSGQALVLVTLGLFAMCGIMGLAIDLGWSYFVEKQAQAAADAAALAAVEEAHARMATAFGFVCPAPTATKPYCQPTAATCTIVSGTTTNNLWNGCLYGQKNGFTDGGMNGHQKVTIQANCGPPFTGCVAPPTAPGVADIAYWVTVRATQTVPQLFSSIFGHTDGVVSAAATAALVSSVVPSSFYGLNREGDCVNTGGNDEHGFTAKCGVDLDINGSGSSPCADNPSETATVCGANGIALASTCHGVTQTGCGSGSGNWAGQTSGSADVWASQAQVASRTISGTNQTGDVNNHNNWTPVPSATSDALATQDPFQGKPQPPLQVPNSPIGTCAIPGGTINGGSGAPLQLGPYQYYATTGGVPSTAKIVLSGNVQFTSTGGCPGTLVTGASQVSSNFPAYIVYGGLELGSSTTFGPGQYILAGTHTSGGTSFGFPSGTNPAVTGDAGAGTQFITTDLNYPGLSGQTSALPAALTNGTIPTFQGNIDMKSGNSALVQLDGLDNNNGNLPTGLGDYNGSLIWQDRRNSTLVFDNLGNVTSSPCNAVYGGSSCSSSTLPSALANNGVTETSPGFIYDARTPMTLNGTIYQPRGAWFSFQGHPNIRSGLQIVTGMVMTQGGGQVDLRPSSLPIIKYRVALIH